MFVVEGPTGLRLRRHSSTIGRGGGKEGCRLEEWNWSQRRQSYDGLTPESQTFSQGRHPLFRVFLGDGVDLKETSGDR